MKRPSAVVVVGGITAFALGLIAACSFPDVAFAPAGGASGDEGGVPEGGSVDGSSDASEDVSNDVRVLVDGGDPNDLIAKDAGKKVDASGCAVCDCDGDGYNETTKAGCGGADAGPNDCDDNDSRAHPGQTYLLDKAEKPRLGDWNCVNGVERLYAANVNCNTVTPGPTCDGTFGFEDATACGETGSFVTCKSAGGIAGLLQSCVVSARNVTQKQACK